MPKIFEATRAAQGSLLVTTVRSGDRTGVSVVNSDAPHYGAINDWIEGRVVDADRLQPDAFTVDALAAFRKDVRPALARELEAGRAESEELDGWLARRLQPPASVKVEHVGAYVEVVRGLKEGEVAGFIQSADNAALAALLAAGCLLTGLSENNWSLLEQTARRRFLVEQLGTQSAHRLAPTPEEPFRHGPDVETAEAEADAVISAQAERRDALAARETHFASTLAMIAAVLGVSPQQVLDEVLQP